MIYKKLSLFMFIFLHFFNDVCLAEQFIYDQGNERSTPEACPRSLTDFGVRLTGNQHDSISFQVEMPAYCSAAALSACKSSIHLEQFCVRFDQDYLVRLNSRGQSTACEYSVSSLNPDTLHSVSVVGCYNRSISCTVATTCKELDIFKTEINFKSIKIIFKKDYLNCKASNYEFNISSNTPDRMIMPFDENSNSIEIRNLLPGTDYVFYRTYKKGEIRMQTISLSFSTPDEIPVPVDMSKKRKKKKDRASGIVSFSHHLISDFTYKFSWELNEYAYGKITGLLIVKVNTSVMPGNNSAAYIGFEELLAIDVHNLFLNWRFCLPTPRPQIGQLVIIPVKFDRTCKEVYNTACPSHFGDYKNKANLHYDTDLRETELKLKPYTEYKIKLKVEEESESDESSKSIGPFSTGIDENITQGETPVFEYAESDLTSIKIFFHYVNCTKVRGPLYLTYKASGIEEWCKEIPQKSRDMKYPFEDNRIIISHLQPYCTYNITIYVSRTDNNWDNSKSLKPFQRNTLSLVIAPPVEELLVISKGKNHVHLRWKNASTPNGDIDKFSVVISASEYVAAIGKDVNACKLWPEYWCHDVNMQYVSNKENKILIIGINRNYLSKENLTEQIKYAKNSRQYAETTVTPIESQPQRPYGARYEWIKNNLLRVFWKHPNCTNGILRRFNISFYISYDENSNNNISADYSLNRGRDDYKLEYQLQETISSQRKIQSLNVSITAINDFGSSPVKLVVPTSPPDPTPYDPGRIKVDGVVLKLLKPSIDAFFEKMFIFKTDMDQKVTEDDYQNKIREIKKLLERGIEPTKTYFMINLIRTYSREENQDIVFKEGSGLFQKNAKYKIAVFTVHSLNGKRIVKIAQKTVSTHDNPSPTAHPAIYIFLAFLLVLPFMGYLLYRYRHKINLRAPSFISAFQRYSLPEDALPLAVIEGEYAESSTSKDDLSIETQEVVRSSYMSFKATHSKRVKVDSFGKYIRKSLENGELLRQHQLFPKWDELKLQEDNMFTCNYGSLPENKLKNRYKKIIPYDHTRVKLSKIPGDEFSDYINANFINGYKLARAYIATQGPTKNTLSDFWRMIWEQNINSIVMLSSLANKKECEVYWPEENGQQIYNEIIVELVDITRHSTYDVRDFKVHYNSNTRMISHIHFKCWPAAGQPLYPQTLVPLLQKMLTLPYFRRSPILVHCSAGIGRTGTVILCDICLRMAAAECNVDVLGVLDNLRSQRPNMVDNLEQYKLAHLVILACLTDWNTSILCDGNFQTTIEGLLDDDIVSRNMTYLKESEWQDDAMKSMTAPSQVPVVPEKNRDPNIVPEGQNHIYLEVLANQDETSAYINAIRVNSFRFSDRYIVTQQPLSNTVSDFWRMVVEQQCIVIINLNEIDLNDETSVQFWPEEDSKIDLQDYIEIQHVQTRHDKEYSIITVRILYRPNEFEQTKITVEILNFKSWPNYQAVPESMDDFMSFVEASAVISTKSQPVVVTCHNGATGCGLFLSTSNLVEQMKLEKQCDICKIVRTIRNCRKQFMEHEIQLGFLYNAAVFYINNFGAYQDLETF